MVSHDVIQPELAETSEASALRKAGRTNGFLDLSYTDGAGVARKVLLHDGEMLIGRAPGCDIHLSTPSISRHHARLLISGQECKLSDAGSTNGTLRNGTVIRGTVTLEPGDSFQCGAIVFTLEQAPAPSSILSEDHQVLSESESIVRRVVDTAVPRPAGTTVTDTAGAQVRIPVEHRAAEPPPVERRKTPERRTAQQPFEHGDRRMGRDRRQARFVRLLGEISKTLVDILPLPHVLSRVVDLVFESVPAERTYLMLRDTADAAVAVRVRRARDGSTPDATLSRTVVTKVMRDGVALLADDARYDSRLDEADSIHTRLDVRSFMCAPLWNRNAVIGVLYADNPGRKRFTAEDLDVFIALANYAAVAIEQARMTEQLQREVQKRERLQRYHSPSVVNRIIHGAAEEHECEAAERDVTIMFADIVGFTAMTERMPPADVARLLNRFFAQMLDIVFEFEGTLDKFIGDAILAVFGAPFAQPDHADRAVHAALGMRKALAELNAERVGQKPLQIRIALNSGLALTGDIGSPRRREFTVLGDVVNACSRIESSVCKPNQIVASGETLRRLTLTAKTTSLGKVSLRGRQAETDVFLIE